jgi:predicted nucleic acid-binding protein
MKGLTLDTGALIAVERRDRNVEVLLRRAREHKIEIAIPAGVLAQAWRDGRRQVRLAKLVATEHVTIEPFDDLRARQSGQLCGVTRTTDVIDASVVLCARSRNHSIVTSDPDDMRRLDPTIELVDV